MKRVIVFYIVSLLLISILLTAVTVVGDNTRAEPDDIPGAPFELFAEFGDGEVYLSWEPPMYQGSSEITNYNIYRGEDHTTIILFDETGEVTEYIDSSVIEGSTYYYQVSAVNSYGEGQKTDEVSITLDGPQPMEYCRISGNLRDHDSSDSVENANLEFINVENRDSYYANSNHNGYFSIEMPPGTYEMKITASGYNDLTDTVNFKDSSSDNEYYMTQDVGGSIGPDDGGGIDDFTDDRDFDDNYGDDTYRDDSGDGTNTDDNTDDNDGDNPDFSGGMPQGLEGQLQTFLLYTVLFALILLISLLITATASLAIFVRLGKIKKELNTLKEAQASNALPPQEYYPPPPPPPPPRGKSR
jgi:hypothetical protein